MICGCTLPLINPDACRTCRNNQYYRMDDKLWQENMKKKIDESHTRDREGIRGQLFGEGLRRKS